MDQQRYAERLPFRSREPGSPRQRKPTSRSRHASGTSTPRSGPAKVSAVSESKEDCNRRNSHRGHEFSNIQARENARMNIGDTYTAEKIIFNQLTNRTGTEQDDKQIDLLEALAFEHMDTRLASISAAQGDTCRWLFDTQEYRRWRRGFRRSRRRFLWIKGKPGAGKSTMMRLAFHEAARDFRKSIVTGYFFNARGHSMAKSTQGMYRSMLHQILSKLGQLPPGVPSSVAASLKIQGWPISTLQNLLRTAISTLR